MREIIERVIPSKLKWYDALYVAGRSQPVSFKNNRLYSISESESSGFGIRVNLNGKTGFSHTNSLDNISETVKRALQMSSFGDSESFNLPDNTTRSFEPYCAEIEKFNIHDEIDGAEKIIDDIKSIYPQISIDLGISSAQSEVRLINSTGVDQSYRESHYGFSISCTYIMPDGSRIETWESRSELKPVDCSELKDILIKKIENGLTVEKIESQSYPVLFPPQAFGRLIGFIASGFNGVSVWKGISPFADMKGEKIFSESFTMIDDPLIEGSPYNIPFDGEGLPVSKNFLIRDGVIETFINDLKYAERLNIKPTGNAYRGYSSLPSPSFHGIRIKPGENSFEDIISTIDKGVLAEQFIGLGQSNTITGDFSANLALAYLIENGKIKGRVKDCMISGNIIDLMKGEFTLSKDVERKGSSLLPYCLFPAVSITA
ncbi:MAG: TldD/PmbA family protein [Spirochaetes bacterium]|nr:TldD/PmbA family protein [Spirochaetota bacterium]